MKMGGKVWIALLAVAAAAVVTLLVVRTTCYGVCSTTKEQFAARPVMGNFKDFAAEKVISELAQQVGARAHVAPGIDCHGPLSLTLHGEKFGEVMTDLCTICSCDWQVEPRGPCVLRFTPKGQPAP